MQGNRPPLVRMRRHRSTLIALAIEKEEEDSLTKELMAIAASSERRVS